jgi:hypothetical protein
MTTTDKCAAGAFEVGGADVSGTAAAAFVQSTFAEFYDSSDTSATLNLSAFADADNLSLLVHSVDGYATESYTVEGTWTEIHQVGSGVNGENVRSVAAYIDSEDTSLTVTNTHNFVYRMTLGFEIAAAAGASGLPGSPVGRKSLLRGLL